VNSGGTLEPAFRTSPQGADLAPCLQAMQLNVDRNQVIQDDLDHSFMIPHERCNICYEGWTRFVEMIAVLSLSGA
jgi:hypothetical protein